MLILGINRIILGIDFNKFHIKLIKKYLDFVEIKIIKYNPYNGELTLRDINEYDLIKLITSE